VLIVQLTKYSPQLFNFNSNNNNNNNWKQQLATPTTTSMASIAIKQREERPAATLWLTFQ